jgi:hypothetical protein
MHKKEEILVLLKELERKNKVKILFAVESGSREWGFASKDSDYDIRAVHYSSVDSYLGLEPVSEQLEFVKGDLDIVSWDIRKFASLFLKSNPTVSEWLKSKTIYIDSKYRKIFYKEFKKGSSKFALENHYDSLARQNYEKYIRGKEEVNLKKYIYILRAVGCINFLVEKNTTPPLNYKKILPYLPRYIAKFMNTIVEKKKKSESTIGKVDKKVNKYIESYFEKKFGKTESAFDVAKINKVVIEIIKRKSRHSI